jgi:serine/threonine-protein kinase
MKLHAIGAAALLATFSLIAPAVVLSQPSQTGDFEPGYWQPEVRIDPDLPVSLTIFNQTGLPLTYNYYSSSVIGEVVLEDQLLDAKGTARVNLGVSSQLADISSVNIYNANGAVLLYDFNAQGNQVTVRVRLRLADSVEEPDLAVYIDEQGRIYSF